MDGSFISLDKRYVLLDREIADSIEALDDDQLQRLRRYLAIMDCECGCRGQTHIEELAQTLVRNHTRQSPPPQPRVKLNFSSRS